MHVPLRVRGQDPSPKSVKQSQSVLAMGSQHSFISGDLAFSSQRFLCGMGWHQTMYWPGFLGK